MNVWTILDDIYHAVKVINREPGEETDREIAANTISRRVRELTDWVTAKLNEKQNKENK